MGDTFKVEVKTDFVRYYKNADTVPFYISTTSAATPTYPLHFDNSIREPKAHIVGAYICVASPTPTTAPCPRIDWRRDDLTQTGGLISASVTSGETLQKTGSTSSWDAGGPTQQRVTSADVYAQVTTSQTDTHTAFGLGRPNNTASYTDINWND